MSENLLNLNNTLQIDDQVYNINAVRSDAAEKVLHSLTVIQHTASGELTTAFDGSTDQTIQYVPASGGKYSGPVFIDNSTLSEVTDDTLLKQAVLNNEQITNEIALLTGAPLYTWSIDNSTQLLVTKSNSDQCYKLNTVVGTSQDFDTFKKLLETGSSGIEFTVNSTEGIVTGVSEDFDTNVVIPYTCEYTYNDGTVNITKRVPVTKIANEAFKDKTTLESVIIPDSVKTLEGSVFEGCTSLTNVILSNELTRIEGATFKNCTSLASIYIPQGVTTIVSSSFANSGLKEITLPSSLTVVGQGAFTGCTLSQIHYEGDAASWGYIDIKSDNNALTTTPIEYSFGYDSNIASYVNLSRISSEPFIYICKEAEAPATRGEVFSNAMFLKLPEVDSFIEISNGAARLNNTDSTKYYTYQNLETAFAHINEKLTSIGLTAASIPHSPPSSMVPGSGTTDPTPPKLNELADKTDRANRRLDIVEGNVSKILDELQYDNDPDMLDTKLDMLSDNIKKLSDYDNTFNKDEYTPFKSTVNKEIAELKRDVQELKGKDLENDGNLEGILQRLASLEEQVNSHISAAREEFDKVWGAIGALSDRLTALEVQVVSVFSGNSPDAAVGDEGDIYLITEE